MDLELPPDLQEFRRSAREFARRDVAPLVEGAEEAERTPAEVFKRAGAAGFLGIRYPEEIGGQGATILAETLLREELSAVCAGMAAALSVSSHLGTYPIHAFGTADQQERYLIPALKGESVSAFALTEPQAGSDLRGLRTRATRDGPGWILNGRKTFITNAPIADFMIVVAVTAADEGLDGLGLFVVDLPGDGIEISRLHKMGHRSSEVGEVALADVRVPEEACVGGARGAWKRVMSTLGIGRVVVSGGAIGLATEALRMAREYAAEREAFGRPIGDNQGVSFPLVRAEAEVEAARLMTYRAAAALDRGDPAVEHVSRAKLLAAEAAIRATDAAVRTFGGYGYMREYPIERLYRDARYFPIVEGTTEIHHRVLAKQTIGR